MTIKKVIYSQVKKQDIYGENIQLTYKGQDKFKTFLGGLVSILLKLMMLAYFSYHMKLVINRQDSNIKQTQLVKKRNQENQFQPSNYGFQIAFGLKQEIDPSYGYYYVNQVDFFYDENRTRHKNRSKLNFDICGENNFNYDNNTYINLIQLDKLQCLLSDDYILQGDYYSEQFKYIEIKLNKCRNSTKKNSTICKSDEEIENFFNFQEFNIAYLNQYFDTEDYEQPIKQTIDDNLFFPIQIDKTKKANLYIQSGKVELIDEYIQLYQEQELEYYTVKNLFQYEEPFKNKEYIGVYIRIDKYSEKYSRQIYGFLEMLGNIGGLFESLFAIGIFMVQFVQKRLFYSNLIKHIYQIRQKNQTEKQKIKYLEYEIKQNIQNQPYLDKFKKNFIFQTIISRRKFNYKMNHIFQYLFRCLICRKLNQIKENKNIKKQIYFENAEKMLHHELDIVTLIKSIKNLNSLAQIFLSQKNKLLLQFQKSNLLETSSSECYSDSEKEERLDHFNSKKNPLKKMITYNKIKSNIKNYNNNNQLNKIDQNLLKGLFERKFIEFDELLIKSKYLRKQQKQKKLQLNLKKCKRKSRFQNTMEQNNQIQLFSNKTSYRTQSDYSLNNIV